MGATRRDVIKAAAAGLVAKASSPAIAAGRPGYQPCGLDISGAAIASPKAWDAAFAARWGLVGPLSPTRINAIVHARDEVYDDTDAPLAWIAHYWVRAFVAMAQLTGAPHYMEACASLADYIVDHTDERRASRGEITEDYLRDPGYFRGTGAGGPFWKRGRNADVLETGQIAQALLRFADCVVADPGRWRDFAPAAERSYATARRAVDAFDNDWQVIGESGSYHYRDSAGSGTLGTTRVAFNQAATMMTAQLLIHRREGGAGRAEKVRRLARCWIDDHARFRADGTVTWPYIVNREQSETEDVVHASVDLDFLVAAHLGGLTDLTDDHMQMLARSFLVHVFNGRDGVSRYVDGTGGSGHDEHWSVGEGWLDLARFEPAVARAVLTIFNARFGPDTGPGVLWARPMLGWARLLQFGSTC